MVTTLLFGYLLYSAYSGVLISYLASGHYGAPFASLQEVPAKGTHVLCVRNESYAYVSLKVQNFSANSRQRRGSSVLILSTRFFCFCFVFVRCLVSAQRLVQKGAEQGAVPGFVPRGAAGGGDVRGQRGGPGDPQRDGRRHGHAARRLPERHRDGAGPQPARHRLPAAAQGLPAHQGPRLPVRLLRDTPTPRDPVTQ